MLDDEKHFWEVAEALLAQPTTRGGARANRPQSYREGTFATNVRLCVLAKENRDMCVQLWSKNPDRKRTLEAIARKAEGQELLPPVDKRIPRTRPGKTCQEKFYTEFAWTRDGAYVPELERVRMYVSWFVEIARPQLSAAKRELPIDGAQESRQGPPGGQRTPKVEPHGGADERTADATTIDANRWMFEGFLGYGRLSAPIWLAGMEEYSRDDADAARRLEHLPRFGQTIGIGEAHRQYGYDGVPKGVVVLDVARQVVEVCDLRGPVGEPEGDVLLTELLPLPRQGNATWPHTYARFYPDKGAYERAVLGPRAERLGRAVGKHRPRVVLVHGARYHAKLSEVLVRFGAQPRSGSVPLDNKEAHLLDLGPSTIVFVHNLGKTTAWSGAARDALVRLVAALWWGEDPLPTPIARPPGR